MIKIDYKPLHLNYFCSDGTVDLEEEYIMDRYFLDCLIDGEFEKCALEFSWMRKGLNNEGVTNLKVGRQDSRSNSSQEANKFQLRSLRRL